VLGRSVKQVSETLVEYLPQPLVTTETGRWKSQKSYVQYRDGSPAAIVERIELILCSVKTKCLDVLALYSEFDPSLTSPHFRGTLDARLNSGDKTSYYFGPPRYMVRTEILRTSPPESYENRWAFYSRELYEATIPPLSIPPVLVPPQASGKDVA
jgi:hypothetical protein